MIFFLISHNLTTVTCNSSPLYSKKCHHVAIDKNLNKTKMNVAVDVRTYRALPRTNWLGGRTESSQRLLRVS